ncbi:MAG: peptidase [Alteromonadaceae bacterium]|nr:MAG: peptidase [Alteromonadaceae bacterium]
MTSQTAVTQGQKEFYRTLWRWHFYAGIFCIPFILTLSVSGAIYLFKPQIDAWVDKPYHNIIPQGERALPNAQIDTALAAIPGAKFIGYTLPAKDTHAVVITAMQKGRSFQVYVDPYRLTVLNKTAVDDRFIHMVKTFHGELLLGTFGSVLVELAACWAIVLVITGLYLWWPRKANGLAGVLYPRLRSNKRIFWRDLHAVVGIWISLFTLLLLFSGLPWSLVWGGALKEVRKLQAPVVQQDWTQGRKQEKVSWMPQASEGYNLTPTLLRTAQTLNLAPPVQLSVASGTSNQWKISSKSQNRMLRADVWVDGNSGEQLRSKTFDQGKPLDRLIGIGISVHEGQLFGWFNQLLGVLTALGLVALACSGFIMWRRRAPDGVLGAPTHLPSDSLSKGVVLIVIALALFLPLLLASLAALWLLEQVLFKHSEVLRQWLGLKTAKPGV